MDKKTQEKIQRKLRWIRDVRNKNYEEWRKDPLGYPKKRAARAHKFEKECSELAKKERDKASSNLKIKRA